MFKSPAQLKNFVLWAKAAGIAELKVGDIAVKFAPHFASESALQLAPVEDNRTPEQIKRDQDAAESDILFWSAR